MSKEIKEIPKGKIPNSLFEQIQKSSSDRGQNIISFLIKRIKNYLLESIAYSLPSSSWRVKLHKWRGVNIGNNVSVGRHCTLDHAYPEYIFLEDNVALTGDVYILTHSTQLDHFKDSLNSFVAPVTIKKGTLVGIRATILPGVTIGENCIISAGAIVSKDVPSKTVVAPARERRIPLIN